MDSAGAISTPTATIAHTGAQGAFDCHIVASSDDQDGVWDQYVFQHKLGTLFHTTGWRDAVRAIYPHEDFYLTAWRDGRVVGVLPLFLVSSRWTGRSLVSVPYGVGGGILADDDETASALAKRTENLAEGLACRGVDMRSEQVQIPGWQHVDRYVGFSRALPTDPADVLAMLPRKARAAARQARDRHNLSITYGDDQLYDVWRIYCVNMRRLSSLSYPLAFFTALIESLPGAHWTAVVRRDNKPVAGLITFLYKDRVLPYFFGATSEARSCHAANFIYLCTMERGVEEGYRIFDFGRSRKDNTGSCNFKRFQGFQPRELGYQQYTAPGRRPVNLSPSNPRIQLARKAWRLLPLPLATRLGAVLSKHIPG